MTLLVVHLDRRCLWCGRPFTPRCSGGSAQRFCKPAHRHAFGTQARRWAIRAIEGGQITVDELKAPGASAHAAVGPSAPESTSSTPEQAQ
jgi:hypothetical protein